MRRGSTKSHTYSVVKGQQVTKDRVTDITNPRTRSQMRQRAVFAEAVKFYKHANQALFKFAFEDKTQTESDYNAFIRHNVSRSIVLMREKVNDINFPAIGNNWQLTAGSMPEPIVNWSAGLIQQVRLESGNITGDETTVGEVAGKLMRTYGLASGDILTWVLVTSPVSDINATTTIPPRWRINQIYLNQEDTTLLEEIGLEVSDGYVIGGGATGGVAGGAFIFSRVLAGGGVKVSNSYLVNNSRAENIVAASYDAAYIESALLSWGAQDEAILKGALAKAPVIAQAAITLGANPIALTEGVGQTSSNIAEILGDEHAPYVGSKLSTSAGTMYGFVMADGDRLNAIYQTSDEIPALVEMTFKADSPEELGLVNVVWTDGDDSITLDGLTLTDGRSFKFVTE